MLPRRLVIATLNLILGLVGLYVFVNTGSLAAAVGSCITSGVAVAMLGNILRDLI